MNVRDNIIAVCTDNEITDLLILAENATPLPWWEEYNPSSNMLEGPNCEWVMGLEVDTEQCEFCKNLAPEEIPDCPARVKISEADFEYLVAAVNAAPVLAKVVRQLREENFKQKAEIDSLKKETEKYKRDANIDTKIQRSSASPTINPQDSIQEDYVICLECGKKFKGLAFHTHVHGLSNEQYKKKYGLDPDIPLINKSGRRKAYEAMCKQLGRPIDPNRFK